jgi:hypothetical protein
MAILLFSVLAHLMKFGTQTKTGMLKLGDNCQFYSIHLNFQCGGGGHLENWPTLPL